MQTRELKAFAAQKSSRQIRTSHRMCLACIIFNWQQEVSQLTECMSRYRPTKHTTIRNTPAEVHKQGALGTSSQASLHQWLHCMSNNQAVFKFFGNLELSCSQDAWGLGRCAECPLFVHLAYQCSFLFVCFVGLYAGHTFVYWLVCALLNIITSTFMEYWWRACSDFCAAHCCQHSSLQC